MEQIRPRTILPPSVKSLEDLAVLIERAKREIERRIDKSGFQSRNSCVTSRPIEVSAK